ncbi:hypothetical protein Clacol_007189 [Clathrus columnatus]|uniref:Methyltransferase domain-containing protein n=1 Tax=Clathrus columnatus TaxID=1419009 RepID=A0AAV5AH26_9AGAM|nr:hypothetical protein Clacol_007189 [Clathrus columnatus]
MSNVNHRYPHGHDESVLQSHVARTAANSAAYLLGYLKPNMDILDIGCGPGTITADFAALVPEGNVIGLEQASEVLERARNNASQRGLKNIQFTTGDAHSLDFPDGTFDVVHAHQVVQYLHDPIEAFREMRRVTKPGGLVAIREGDMSALVLYPEIKDVEESMSMYIRAAQQAGGTPKAGRQLIAWARKAGFKRKDITATASTWCFNTPQDRAWWGKICADRMTVSSFAKSAIEAKIATKEELERYAQAWRTWAADEDGWLSMVHSEIPDATVSECRSESISLSIDPTNPPVPPFYLFAYEQGGTTTVANLGSDVADLTWTVNHPSGTVLLITIIDSKGNSGGVGPEFFFVFSDGNSSCHNFVPSPISVVANITSASTKTVETCVPIQFQITGGQKPYTASIGITGAPSILNFTMGNNDDTLIWFNRAPPPQSILFTVSDAKGQYSFSTGLGISSGFLNSDCGLDPAALEFDSAGGSTSTFSAPSTTTTDDGGNTQTSISLPFDPPDISTTHSTFSSTPSNGTTQFSKKKTNTGAIAGGVVGGVVVIVLIAFTIFYYCSSSHRKRVISRNAPVDLNSETDETVTPFVASESVAQQGSVPRPSMSQLERGMSVAGSSSGGSSAPLISRPTKTVLAHRDDQTEGSTIQPSSSSIRETTSTSILTSEPNAQVSQSPPGPVIVRQHVDIADASPDEVLELPPAYSDRRTELGGRQPRSTRNK